MNTMKRLWSIVLCICLGLTMLCAMPAAANTEVEATNLVANPSFDTWREDSSGYLKASSWSASWTEGMTQESVNYNTAPYAMTATPAEGKTINARQYVEVEPGTPYRFSLYYYTEDAAASNEKIQVGFGYYNNSTEKKSVHSGQTFPLAVETSGAWAPLTLDFETPQDCGYLWICIYAVYPAAGIMDDVSLTKTGAARVAYGDTDGVFYYKEEIGADTAANAVVTLNPAHITEVGDTSGYRAAVTLADSAGNSLYTSETVPFTEGEAALSFPLSAITTLQEKHTIRLTVTNGAETLWTDEKSVYVYPRPLTLDAEGYYYRQVYETDSEGAFVPDENSGAYVPKTENGSYVFETEPFQPSVVYHVDRPKATTADEDNTYLQAKKAGANLIQFQSYYATPEAVKEALDDCTKYGLMALICLNRDNDTPAGSTANAANTVEVVKIAKNHPATFGYIVMDEPFSHMTDTMLSDLENSYRIIRNEDAVHPVFITDNNANYFKEHARYTDIMSIDEYPQSAENSAYSVKDRITAAKQFSGMRPVYAILQAFPYGSVDGGPQRGLEAYIPTGAQYLHMWYQAMVAGAQGIGFYELYSKASYGPYWLYKTEELAELWGAMTYFADNEMEKSYTFFQKSSLIKTVEGENCTVQLRYMNGETYAVVLSGSHLEASEALQNVCTGKIRELYAGTADNAVSIDGDTWTMQLAPSAVSIYLLQTEGIIVSRSGTVVQSVEKGQTYSAEVTAEPAESGAVTLFAAVYQTDGAARKLLQLLPLASGTAVAGAEMRLSGTFTVPESLTEADEIKVLALSGETLQGLTDAVALPVSKR